MDDQGHATTREQPLIGLLPAGGQATRIAPLPCSKELYPIGFWPHRGGPGLRPKVACHYLLESLRLAGVDRSYIILRPGKWDIPAYLGDGAMLDTHIAYLIMGVPFGAPYTLDQAYPFARHALIAFGFPDIIFSPADAFARLLRRQAVTGADVVLGLFPHHDPQAADMVEVDHAGRVRSISIKRPGTDLRYAWVNAVWTPSFTRFMHEYLATQRAAADLADARGTRSPPQELFVGDVVQAAVDSGSHVNSELFPDGIWVDIGTPEGLREALRTFG